MNETSRDRNTALIISLVLGLVQAAYQQLGKLRNEVTGKVETHLDAARVTIDTIAALELRTRGQRSDEETQVMKRALAELRMNYVDEVKKAASAAPPTGEPTPATSAIPEETHDQSDATSAAAGGSPPTTEVSAPAAPSKGDAWAS